MDSVYGTGIAWGIERAYHAAEITGTACISDGTVRLTLLLFPALLIVSVSALRYRLKVAAERACKPLIAAFAECCKEKSLTVVFFCRTQLHDMNDCLKQW